MKLNAVAARLRKGDISYALGRFRTIRTAYGGIRRLVDRADRPVSVNECPSLFPEASVANIVQTIRKEAVFVGLNLPAHVVAEIDAFSRSEPLRANYDPNGPTFRYFRSDPGRISRRQIRANRGYPRADQPTRCPAVQAIVDDPSYEPLCGLT